MDIRTEKILKKIKNYSKFKKFLVILCFFTMFLGISIINNQYQAITSKEIKIISENKNFEKFQGYKIMLSPSINIERGEGEVYQISAQRAISQDLSEIELENVEANGEIGKIKAGKLKIIENGDILQFSQRPVLILKKTK
ncbi:MAG: hypothetical protein LW595_03845 [Rickettsiales bacterium]|nr:hypothetical protein [Rickettsiales bacterium]